MALLFDPDRAGAIWLAVEQLAADAAVRRQLGEAARIKVSADFTWQGSARRIAAWAAADRAARGWCLL